MRLTALLLAAFSPFLLNGCVRKNVQAAAPVSSPPIPDVRPMTIAPDTDASPPLEATAAPAPTMPAPSAAAAPPVTVASNAVVPPPKKPTPQAPAEESAEQDAHAGPEPPLRITPQLSPSDQAADQRQLEEDSAVANKNLQTASSRQLNATQKDLFDKIRGYLSQATDAGKGGDWLSASLLAHKAKSLSVELVDSL
jgi:DedD protein